MKRTRSEIFIEIRNLLKEKDMRISYIADKIGINFKIARECITALERETIVHDYKGTYYLTTYGRNLA